MKYFLLVTAGILLLAVYLAYTTPPRERFIANIVVCGNEAYYVTDPLVAIDNRMLEFRTTIHGNPVEILAPYSECYFMRTI